ncbi:hypothetical protein [Streptomyces oceani]|uniref:hypothetical protein n=1 Tax=Streptomyces oceani TaxID=1075402 RepID=UPI000872C10D|nr:hypothetical protein [Streptomyces oceani]
MSKQTDPARFSHSDSVTPAGADWLASASRFPRSVHALWALRPTEPSVLPCGSAFDVVSAPLAWGRLLLDQLTSAGPGSGPTAVHRGRVLLLTAVGTADRLPMLLTWDEWRAVPYERAHRPDHVPYEQPPPDPEAGGDGAAPFRPFAWLLCHGLGESVSVPALAPASRPYDSEPRGTGAHGASRWLVAPRRRHPWLPTAGDLLHAALGTRAAQRRASADAGPSPGGGAESVFTPQEPGARVYDVSRRR